MAADDYLDSEVALVAGATAAILSSRVREVLRTGAVYGTAGVMAVGDTALGALRGAGRGVQQMAGRSSDGRRASPASASGGSSARSRSGSTRRRSGGRHRSSSRSGGGGQKAASTS
jgi:hypothetical protein